MAWMQCSVGPNHPRSMDGVICPGYATGEGPKCTMCTFACYEPEAPHRENRTSYDERCPACLIAAQAAVKQGHGDDYGYVTGYQYLTLAEWLVRVERQSGGW